MLGSVKKGGKKLHTNLFGDLSVYLLSFDSTGAANPDGVDPSESVSVVRTGVGTFTITFEEDAKPRNIEFGFVNVTGNTGISGHFDGYVRATGVVTIYTSDAGVLADVTDNETVQVCLFLGHDKLTDAA